MNCPKCDTEHDPTRCSSHVVKDPQTREPIPPRQCGKTPVKGSTVCRSHGAAKGTPAAAAAADRVQTEAAEKELAKLWVGLKNAEAVADPVASMARLAGALEQMLDQVGATVNEIKTTAAGANLQSVRGEIVLLERIASLLGRTLDSMARLGIAERQVELQAEQAQLVSTAFRAVMGLAFVQALVPGERDLMVRTFLTGIGVQLEALEVSA